MAPGKKISAFFFFSHPPISRSENIHNDARVANATAHHSFFGSPAHSHLTIISFTHHMNASD